MDALEVLDRLAERGVVAVLENSRLYLEPGSKVPPDLMAEAHAHRMEIIGALRHRQMPADTGLRPLLERLRADQAWLTDHFGTYAAGLEAEGPYVASLTAWDVLERLLRRLYPHYQACISEPGACNPAAPVWCSACGDVSSTTSGEPVP